MNPFIYDIDLPDGSTFVVSLISMDDVSSFGLPNEAIIGQLMRDQTGEPIISPESFKSNQDFVAFMQQSIARHALNDQEVIMQARTLGNGIITLNDERRASNYVEGTEEDIVGWFKVENGKIAAYRPNPDHLLLSQAGWFQLPSRMQERLLADLVALSRVR